MDRKRRQKDQRQQQRMRKWWIGIACSIALLMAAGIWAMNWATDYVLRSFAGFSEETDKVEWLEEPSFDSSDPASFLDAKPKEKDKPQPLQSIEEKMDQSEETQLPTDKDIGNTDARQAEEKHEAEGTDEKENSLEREGAAYHEMNRQTDRSGSGKKEDEREQENTEQNDQAGSESSGSELEADESSNDEQTNSESSGSQTPSDQDSFVYSPEVTLDKAKKVEQSISLKEQTKVMTTLVKRLNASDISKLTRLMQGGMNVEEKKEAKKIILERLQADEYNELIQIAAKYGLSQGKSYEDSVKQFD